MTSLATFKTTYLAPGVLPLGARGQLAGEVTSIDVQVSGGATVAQGLANILNKRTYRVVHKAQRESGITPGFTYQGNLIADFLALNAA